MNQVQSRITYFAEEGRVNLPECLRLSFEAAISHGIEKLVIFTNRGQGITLALEQYLHEERYKQVRVIAVTFPQGFGGTDDNPDPTAKFTKDERDELRAHGIPVVKAHLPFEPIQAQYANRGVLAQDLSIVGNALNIFCGSMSLCIQGVLMTCDAGEVNSGEPVVVMTSDTSLIVQASTTARFLNDLIVREMVCKPAFLTIGKNERHLLDPIEGDDIKVIEAEVPRKELPATNPDPL